MELILFHPGAARIDCGDCAKWVFNLETGEKEVFKSGPERKELPVVRQPGEATPCHSCAKESPEHAQEIELSPRNWRCWRHYREGRAVGLCELERRDPLVRKHFALLAALEEQYERHQSQADSFQGLKALVKVMRR